MELFADAVVRGDLEDMNRQLQQTVLSCAFSFDSGIRPVTEGAHGGTAPENFFHGLTLGMLTCLSEDYHVRSNREGGFGRYDVCLEPRDNNRNLHPCIFEFKVYSEKDGDHCITDTARRALRQIKEKHYDTDLLERGFSGEQIRRYGIGFRGKETCIVE